MILHCIFSVDEELTDKVLRSLHLHLPVCVCVFTPYILFSGRTSNDEIAVNEFDQSLISRGCNVQSCKLYTSSSLRPFGSKSGSCMRFYQLPPQLVALIYRVRW